MDHDPHQAEGEKLPQPLHCVLLNLAKWLQKAAGSEHVLSCSFLGPQKQNEAMC